jgi:hypothetical protein
MTMVILSRFKLSKIAILFLLTVDGGCSTVSIEKPSFPFVISSDVKDKASLRWTANANMNGELARVFIDQRSEILDRLIAPTFDPYFGTKSKTCGSDSPPPAIKGSSTDGFWALKSVFSSDRFVVGSCPDPKTAQKTQYLMLYCSQERTVYVIHFFRPNSESWALIPAASCRRSKPLPQSKI